MASSPSSAGTYSHETMYKAHVEDQVDGKVEDLKALQEIDLCIDECRRMYQTPLINERTRKELDKMWEGLRSERKVKYMQENVRYLYEAISEAQDYEAQFKRKLNEAVEKKWIGKVSRDKWMKRFNDPNVLEWDRKKWIMDDFDEYFSGWKETAEVRLEVRRLAKKLNVKENRIPELRKVMKIQEFLALPFKERKNKVYAAKAALIAYERKHIGLFDQVKATLDDAAGAGYMHKSKVGEWLNRIMEADDPFTFVNDTVKPFIQNWKAARETFNELHEDMRKNGSPRGLRVLTANAFLLLNYEQRMSYLQEVRLRIKDSDSPEEKDPALDSMKKRIRHLLDTKDWDDAAAVLTIAQARYDDDEDLDSMQEYLRTHAQKKPSQQLEEKETPDPMEIAENMRAMIREMPEDLQWMYLNAMRKGPRVFGRLLQLMYNRVWVYEHNYGNEHADRIHAESEFNKEQTEHYIENGHSRKFERNIIEGDTASRAAIRDDCHKPQVLYMGDQGRESVLDKVEINAENELFGYWTTLVPKDLSYARHRNIVRNHNYKLKQGMKQLDKMGYMFTLHGSLDRKHGTADAIVPSSKQVQAPKSIPTYSSLMAGKA